MTYESFCLYIYTIDEVLKTGVMCRFKTDYFSLL